MNQTLEKDIIPLYYVISDDGIHNQCVRMMKAAVKHAALMFSGRRMVKEYIEQFYAPVLKSLETGVYSKDNTAEKHRL